MAGLGFKNVKGKGSSDRLDQYKHVDGDNSVRLFGNILPRYLYWLKNAEGKDVPFECLAFNRETETFDNKEKDWVKEYFPDAKASWSYSMLCLDKSNNPKVFNFKSKLFQQIMSNVEDLGDPTDPENGWDLKYAKKKTGPSVMNVEYTLQTVKCLNSKGPLTDAQREVIAASKTIEELMPRVTPDQQKEALEKLISGASDKETVDETVGEELEAQ